MSDIEGLLNNEHAFASARRDRMDYNKNSFANEIHKEKNYILNIHKNEHLAKLENVQKRIPKCIMYDDQLKEKVVRLDRLAVQDYDETIKQISGASALQMKDILLERFNYKFDPAGCIFPLKVKTKKEEKGNNDKRHGVVQKLMDNNRVRRDYNMKNDERFLKK